MSGHNKWSKIKHKKASTDAQKSKIFSKLVRYITVESRKSKGDLNSPGLAFAIDKAKAANMPGDTIDRAVKKGSTDNSAQMESITYEAYGPGGVAIIIEALTDNRNKAAQEVTNFLLQEGVPTIHRIEENPSEVCIYQIDNNLVGGFYRFHTGKGSRENLNSPGGMAFQKMCPHLDKYGKDCGTEHDLNIFDIYRILARIAGVAATEEIKDLENKKT